MQDLRAAYRSQPLPKRPQFTNFVRMQLYNNDGGRAVLYSNVGWIRSDVDDQPRVKEECKRDEHGDHGGDPIRRVPKSRHHSSDYDQSGVDSGSGQPGRNFRRGLWIHGVRTELAT